MKLLVFLFAIAYGQFGQRCKHTPPQWSGLMREVNYDAFGSGVAYRFARIDYDSTNQTIHILEYERDANGRQEVVDELFLFEKDKMFRAYRGGECEVSPIGFSFRPFGVPEGAKFEGVEYLGGISSGLRVENFFLKEEDRLGGGVYYSSFVPTLDQSSCYPVTEAFINMEARFPPLRHNVHFTFTNITTVIPPGAFVIPSNCSP